WTVPSRKRSVRRLALAVAWLLIVAAITIAWQASQTETQNSAPQSASERATVSSREWLPFSPEALASAQKEGKAVYVDFTAAWCAVCQANKLIAFEGPGSDQVWEKINEMGVVMLRADWTSKDPV